MPSLGSQLLAAGVYGGAALGVLVILIAALADAVAHGASGSLGSYELIPVFCVAAAIVGALAGAIPGAVAWMAAAATRPWSPGPRAVFVGTVCAIPSAGVALAVSTWMVPTHAITGTLVGTLIGAVGLFVTAWSVLRTGESPEPDRRGGT